MRLTFLFSIFLAIAVSTHATNIQVSGEVSGTWDVDTVLVMDNLLVPSNFVLTINPGVKVIFNGFFAFKVEGQVFAQGLETDSISFFVTDTIGLHNVEITKGAWAGFWFEPIGTISDSSIFEFCDFKYGKAVSADTIEWNGGAIGIVKYNNIRISNCSFTENMAYKNGGAIYSKSSHIKIENCDFTGNAGGTALEYGYGGAVCLQYSDAKIYRNYFTQNSSTGVGGGLVYEFSNPDIDANYFFDNFSAIGGGLCCLRSPEGNSISNNLFESNSALFFGGGVAFLEAHTLFVNNTIVNNYSSYGGGIFVNAAAMPKLKNCIIWSNMTKQIGDQVWVYDVYSAPEFYYNNIQGGFEGFGGSGTGVFIGVYENNIDTLPMFSGVGDMPFSLAEESPGINAGTPDTVGLLLPATDLAGQARIKEARIDMGCYESQGNTATHHISMDDNELFIAPNPLRNQSTFYLNVANLSSSARLIIYNSNGSPVKTFNIDNQKTINWNGVDDSGNRLPAGIYLYQLKDEQSVYTKKMVIGY